MLLTFILYFGPASALLHPGRPWDQHLVVPHGRRRLSNLDPQLPGIAEPLELSISCSNTLGLTCAEPSP